MNCLPPDRARPVTVFVPDATPADISALQTWKGWLFIILTSLLLSLLVHRSATDSDKGSSSHEIAAVILR